LCIFHENLIIRKHNHRFHNTFRKGTHERRHLARNIDMINIGHNATRGKIFSSHWGTSDDSICTFYYLQPVKQYPSVNLFWSPGFCSMSTHVSVYCRSDGRPVHRKHSPSS
jgi:hypothetical protein